MLIIGSPNVASLVSGLRQFDSEESAVSQLKSVALIQAQNLCSSIKMACFTLLVAAPRSEGIKGEL